MKNLTQLEKVAHEHARMEEHWRAVTVTQRGVCKFIYNVKGISDYDIDEYCQLIDVAPAIVVAHGGKEKAIEFLDKEIKRFSREHPKCRKHLYSYRRKAAAHYKKYEPFKENDEFWKVYHAYKKTHGLEDDYPIKFMRSN